ncbi:protein FAM149B1-like isoform X2 [Mya arenaria]|uniref:protein FAM149B1-like isoform X2 n=1 Tax=Mya arenaria TaxID=6604 RepID=UPI0022E086B8|nr:protein FAM149B1-like isoform X2 [Mya arenaria]
MGTEVAARPSIPTGLPANNHGPGRRKRERSFSSSGSVGSNANSSSKPVYARDYSLRIQRKKYSLAKAIVCVGAKIHHRTSPALSLPDDKLRQQQVFQENSKLSSNTTGRIREISFISESNSSQRSYATNQKAISKYSDSQDYKNRYRAQGGVTEPYVGRAVLDKNDSQESHFSAIQSQGAQGFDSWPLEFPFQYDDYVEESYYRYYDNDTHGRGLSRGVLDDHPTLEIVTANQPLPPDFSKKIVDAITSYHETPASSQRSSPTITEDVASSSQSVQEDLCQTGYTTERSSVDSQYSWDEFDRQAAKTVQRLFDEIDSVLFELRSNQAEQSIYKECQEWGTLFPHLRVLGRQLVPVQDAGFELIEREMSRPNTTSSLDLVEITDHDLSLNSQDSQGLSISGRSVRAKMPPPEARSRNASTPSTQSEFSFLEEEIYEQEGEYEEIIAIDYKDIYEEHSDHKKQLTPRRRRVAYPPVTPNACFKDSVASSAFDCMWHEIISWIRPLLKKYSITIFDNKPQHQSMKAISDILRNESTPGPPSRENSYLKNVPLGSRAHTMIEAQQLVDLLHISPKIPIPREASNLGDMADTHQGIPSTRPVSSLPIGMNRRPPTTRGYGPRNVKNNVKLAPIQHDRDRSKTPSVDEDQSLPLRVRKIDIGQTASPTYNPRNGALPPIGTPGPLELEQNSRLQKKLVSSRASSAVDKDLRVVYRDRLFGAPDTRPSTTHAFRSETPVGLNRRASTPFNSSAFNNPPLSRNSYGAGGMHLDIRGSGLQPSHDLGQLGNIPQEEDTEGMEEPVHQNQWTPSTPSHNNPYRRSRQVSSLVRS